MNRGINEQILIENTVLEGTGTSEVYNEELTEKEKNLLKECNIQLKHLWEQDEFKNGFLDCFQFYYYKLENKVKDPSIKHQLKDYFYEYLSSVLYQGYFIGKQFVTSEDILVKDDHFVQPDGIILQQIPSMIERATDGLIKSLEDHNTKKFEEWILKENKNILGSLEQIKVDIACLGAFYAFKNERKSRSVEIREEGKYGILHRVDDVLFLNPQMYAICLIGNDNSELWEIHKWSSFKVRDTKMGEIHIMKYSSEETNYAHSNFVMYEGVENISSLYDNYHINIKLSEFVPDKEIFPIQALVHEQMVKQTNTLYENIIMTLTIYTSNTLIQYNPNKFE